MDMEISFPGGKKVSANYCGHTIATDQPEGSGGQDSAPTPFQLFLASIGTCAAYYVLAFCQSRDLPTENIRLSQSISRDEEKKMVTQVAIDIHLPPDFPEKYQQAVISAAAKCAVKKHLQDPPEIAIHVKQ